MADEENSDSSDAEGARSFFQKWSRPSAGFAADNYAAFSKYVECGKAWLRKQAVVLCASIGMTSSVKFMAATARP